MLGLREGENGEEKKEEKSKTAHDVPPWNKKV
jgi:hypothetical protein